MSAKARDRWRALPREVRAKVEHALSEHAGCWHCLPHERQAHKDALTLLR